jgi:hypothetical protein
MKKILSFVLRRVAAQQVFPKKTPGSFRRATPEGEVKRGSRNVFRRVFVARCDVWK